MYASWANVNTSALVGLPRGINFHESLLEQGICDNRSCCIALAEKGATARGGRHLTEHRNNAQRLGSQELEDADV
jgi:hypothetical protein